MDLLPTAFPTLSPLVVEDVKPRKTEHEEVLQDRAEAALSAKARAASGAPARMARRARCCRCRCLRSRGGWALGACLACASLTRRASLLCCCAHCS